LKKLIFDYFFSMVVERYIIDTHVDISPADLENENSLCCSSRSHDPFDSGCETSSLASYSRSSLIIDDTPRGTTELQSLRCENEGRLITLFPCRSAEVCDPLKVSGLREAANSLYENKSQKKSSSLLNDAVLLSTSTTLCELSDWQNGTVPMTQVFERKELRKPKRERQQCTFCGKYEKPDKSHLTCDMCCYAKYCRVKCQNRDRERHRKHDCLVCETTPWFSIARYKKKLLDPYTKKID